MVRIVETTGLLTRLAEYNQNHDAAGKFSSGMTVRALAMGVQAKAADAAAAGAGPGSLEDRAKAVYGVTNDIREAGYITPDGSMLDFSGRHASVGYHRQGDRFVPNDGKPDYLAGQRSVDHREVDALYPDSKGSGDDLLNMTVQSGFARVHGMGPDLAVEVGPNLTDRQFTTLARNSRDFTSVTVARTKPNGQPDMNAVYSNFAKVGVPNVSVLRNIATISEALYEATLVEFNQNHGSDGRFSSGLGGAILRTQSELQGIEGGEAGVFLNADGTVAFRKQASGDVDGSGPNIYGVRFDEDEVAKMHGTVSVHNHPTTSSYGSEPASFSDSDLYLAQGAGLKETRVIDHGGTVYSMRPGADGWGSRYKLAEAMTKAKAEQQPKYKALYDKGTLTLQQANSKGQDAYVRSIAQQMGWTYEVKAP